MKRLWLLALLGLLAAPAFAQRNPPEIPYKSVPNYFKYPFEMNLGDMASVAVNSKGHVYMLSRSNISGPAYGQMGAQILEFDQNGVFLHEVAPRLYAWSFVHGIRVDADDNVWVADKGSDMVVKISGETGHVLQVYGRRVESSDGGGQGPKWEGMRAAGKLPPASESDFRQPTDIAFDPQGNTFISDGYVNSRVAAFTKKGVPLRQFGEFGKGPGQFNNPHSIAIDKNGNIYVADRGNQRTQVFDNNGKYLREFKLTDIPAPPGLHVWTMGYTSAMVPGVGVNAVGAPWSLCITPGPTQYLYVGDGYPSRVYKIALDGKDTVLGMFGTTGRELGEFGWIHGIACPSENVLYLADENNWRVQKVLLTPGKQMQSQAGR